MTKYEIVRARELLEELLSSAYEIDEDENLDGDREWFYYPMDTTEHALVLSKALATLESISDMFIPKALKPLNVEWATPIYDETPTVSGTCPVCGWTVYDCQDYCENCGQGIDWSDSE